MAFSLNGLAHGDPELFRRLEAYFQCLEASDAALVSDAALGLLLPARALELSERFQSFHPLVQSLSGLVLSDNQTSDHHVLALGAPMRGSVFHLSHDGESRFVFEDVEAFLLAARRANEAGEALEERHPMRSLLAKDQEGLRRLIVSLLSHPAGADIVPTLLGSLDLVDPVFLVQLIDDEDFYMGEAVGREIAHRPSPHLLLAAEHCAHHAHPMVRTAGLQALQRVRELQDGRPG